MTDDDRSRPAAAPVPWTAIAAIVVSALAFISTLYFGAANDSRARRANDEAQGILRQQVTELAVVVAGLRSENNQSGRLLTNHATRLESIEAANTLILNELREIRGEVANVQLGAARIEASLPAFAAKIGAMLNDQEAESRDDREARQRAFRTDEMPFPPPPERIN